MDLINPDSKLGTKHKINYCISVWGILLYLLTFVQLLIIILLQYGCMVADILQACFEPIIALVTDLVTRIVTFVVVIATFLEPWVL